jgi:hypothetical protein
MQLIVSHIEKLKNSYHLPSLIITICKTDKNQSRTGNITKGCVSECAHQIMRVGQVTSHFPSPLIMT